MNEDTKISDLTVAEFRVLMAACSAEARFADTKHLLKALGYTVISDDGDPAGNLFGGIAGPASVRLRHSVSR